MGIGECAGEVVSPIDFDLAAAEREVFEAQVAFEGGQVEAGRKDGLSSPCCTRRKRLGET